jgi:hypothetical protein
MFESIVTWLLLVSVQQDDVGSCASTIPELQTRITRLNADLIAENLEMQG